MRHDHIREDVHRTTEAIEAFERHLVFGRDDAVARVLEDFDGLLRALERELVTVGVRRARVRELVRALDDLEIQVRKLLPDLRAQAVDMVSEFRSLVDRLGRERRSLDLPVRSLLGRLPVVRWIPQDVHSVMDSGAGVACLLSAMLGQGASARRAAAAFGIAMLAVSLCSDHRFGIVRAIPMEIHEGFDYVWGISAMASPLLFGGVRRCRSTKWSLVLAGAVTVLSALGTDYRAATGVGRHQ